MSVRKLRRTKTGVREGVKLSNLKLAESEYHWKYQPPFPTPLRAKKRCAILHAAASKPIFDPSLFLLKRTLLRRR